MYRVYVLGWKHGYSVYPIPFAKIVRKHCGGGLVHAKKTLDNFSDKGEVTLTFGDEDRAQAFINDVTELGAKCELFEDG